MTPTWDQLAPQTRAVVISLLGGDHDAEELKQYQELRYAELPSGLKRRLTEGARTRTYGGYRMTATAHAPGGNPAQEPIPDYLIPSKLKMRVQKNDQDAYYLFTLLSVNDAPPALIPLIPISFDKLADAMDQVDHAGTDVYAKLAAGEGLPAEPFSQKLLRPVLMGLAQIAWHKAHGQPEEVFAKIYEKQVGRTKHYLTELDELKKHPPAASKGPQLLKDEVRKGGGGGTRAPRSSSSKGASYQVAKAFVETASKYTGQKGFVIAAFVQLGGVATSAQLTAAIEALPEGKKMPATQPVEKVVSFYVTQWKKLGLLEEVTVSEQPQGSAAPPADQGQTAPPAERPVEPGEHSAGAGAHSETGGVKPDLSKLNTGNGKGKGKKKK